MMKLTYIKATILLLTMGTLFLSNGCQVEEGDEDKMVQERRLFDLYLSYNFNDGLEADESLYFKEVKAGTGQSPGPEDWVLLNYVGYVIPEDRVVDTYIENVMNSSYLDPNGLALHGPVKMQVGDRTEGLAQGLQMMKDTGQAIICYTSDLGYGSNGASLMSSVGSFASMKYEVELLAVLGEDIVAYEMTKLKDYVDNIPGAEPIYDEITDTEMYYVIDESSDSTQVAVDSVVSIAYKGYLIDGRVFDESAEGDTYSFTVGDREETIAGWSVGLVKFRVGEKGRLFIPYQLAYGELGRSSSGFVTIPPYETLVFDIEIVAINDEDPHEPDPESNL